MKRRIRRINYHLLCYFLCKRVKQTSMLWTYNHLHIKADDPLPRSLRTTFLYKTAVNQWHNNPFYEHTLPRSQSVSWFLFQHRKEVVYYQKVFFVKRRSVSFASGIEISTKTYVTDISSLDSHHKTRFCILTADIFRSNVYLVLLEGRV